MEHERMEFAIVLGIQWHCDGSAVQIGRQSWHRGASAQYAENAHAAFSGALEPGADGSELDLRPLCIW